MTHPQTGADMQNDPAGGPIAVAIEYEPIELVKLVKWANLVQSGGEAKQIINQGQVSVNGSIETRKGRKIYSGDIISIAKQQFQVIIRSK